MFSTAHLAAGLIIGKLSGDYPTAILGAVAIDIDHFFAFHRHKLLNTKDFLKAVTGKIDFVESPRHVLHNVVVWSLLSGAIFLFNMKIGVIFFLSHLSHLVFDALDDSPYYPLFPYKKINIRGPIGYFSKAEFIFTVILFGIFFAI